MELNFNSSEKERGCFGPNLLHKRNKPIYLTSY